MVAVSFSTAETYAWPERIGTPYYEEVGEEGLLWQV